MRRIELVPAAALADGLRAEVLALCSRAYEEDFAYYLDPLPAPLHVLAFAGDRLVSHACIVTRWLQAGSGPLMRTAYVEAVATEPDCERRGHATAVMRAAAAAAAEYDIAALGPSDPAFYARLGWELWRGPLQIRLPDGAVAPGPEGEQAMIFRTSRTPPLDLGLPLSIEWRPGAEVW